MTRTGDLMPCTREALNAYIALRPHYVQLISTISEPPVVYWQDPMTGEVMARYTAADGPDPESGWAIRLPENCLLIGGAAAQAKGWGK